MKAAFTVLSGSDAVELQLKLPCLIGRSKQASVKVKNSLISREHCQIYEQDGQLVIRDLGSMNGTYVNDQRIGEPTLVESGDTIRVGMIELRADQEDGSMINQVVGLEAASVESPSVLDGYSESELGSFIDVDRFESSNTGDMNSGNEGETIEDSALDNFFRKMQ